MVCVYLQTNTVCSGVVAVREFGSELAQSRFRMIYRRAPASDVFPENLCVFGWLVGCGFAFAHGAPDAFK